MCRNEVEVNSLYLLPDLTHCLVAHGQKGHLQGVMGDKNEGWTRMGRVCTFNLLLDVGYRLAASHQWCHLHGGKEGGGGDQFDGNCTLYLDLADSLAVYGRPGHLHGQAGGGGGVGGGGRFGI